MPSLAAELLTVTVSSPVSVISCSRGCKTSRTLLPITGARRSQHETLILHQLHWLPIRQAAAYSFQDGRVGVQVSARYGSILPVDILHPNVIT